MEQNRTLIVGATSFIGKHIRNCDKVSYKDFHKVDLTKYDVVVNCALHPLYKTSFYRTEIDVDLEVGLAACQAGCHYVMISTSKVYGGSRVMVHYDEMCRLLPYDDYSKNKAITEMKLLANFPDKITILRGSNIFGFEYGRNSYVGYCMGQLVNEGVIKLTMNPETKRDFLFVEDAARIIEKVCEVKPIGVYNLSSNQPISAISILDSLIAGYEYGGDVMVLKEEYDRQFALNNNKLKDALGIQIGPFDFEKIFFDLGKQLCKI